VSFVNQFKDFILLFNSAYIDQGNFQQAAFYYYRKEKAKPALFNNDNMEDLFLLSTIYEKSNQIDSALLYAEKAQDYDLIENGKRSRTPLYINLGNIYYKKKNYDHALKYYRIAQQIHDFSYYLDVVVLYNGMAKTFVQNNLIDSGIHYAQKAIDLRDRILYPLGTLDSYQILSDLYKKNGQYDSALNYMEKTNELRNTFFNQQIERDIQNISFNEKLYRKTITQDKQHRNNIIITADIAIILFITAILFWRNIQHRKKLLRYWKSKT
jgi:tetratricopeptide (TPR) repeat protein